MKKQLILLAALGCTIASMQSCAVSSGAQTADEINSKPSAEAATTCFIELKDGSFRRFKTLKLVTGVFTAPHLLADGKEKITASQIKAYQNSEHYAVSQDLFKDNIRSKSAVETLPGFAVRIAKGKLNIYCKKYYNGVGTAEQLFVQKDGGDILAFTPELMASMLKDHPEAEAFFNSTKKITPASKRLQATVALMNKGQLLSMN
ncbi:MAG: hypothetical protein EOO06_16325 [Chitinophagaceae bacterium]|nr:MAG: hypothetical protein EOO06_16325 [Chitinophagaceae bacterium]